jgi:hypothetical protein
MLKQNPSTRKQGYDNDIAKEQVVQGERGPTFDGPYAKMRRRFTASDLQKCTEVDAGIPLEEVIAKLEKAHRKFNARIA